MTPQVDSTMAVTTSPPQEISSSSLASRRRRDLFGDCALIEIIHLHDCLRGALNALQKDVTQLSQTVLRRGSYQDVAELERRVAGRFQVIWSVFRAHSAAEDEFIWPALQLKTQGLVRSTSPKQTPGGETIEQQQYKEDHADEERMFSTMDSLLTQLRKDLLRKRQQTISEDSVDHLAGSIDELTKSLSHHLMAHLEKEETQCMPLVIKHLSRSEIHDLVGQIMGKRSSEMIAQIMSMAVQNLNEVDREEMVRYMKQAMAGTFFDRWLAMSGWMSETPAQTKEAARAAKRGLGEEDEAMTQKRSKKDEDQKPPARTIQPRPTEQQVEAELHKPKEESEEENSVGESGMTSSAELEKLIRAVVSNSELTPKQKHTTIQGLRDSVWRSNQRHKQQQENGSASLPSEQHSASEKASHSNALRDTPPTKYFKKTKGNLVQLVWSSNDNSSRCPEHGSVPLFSDEELAPTYHGGATGAVLGCPHYARSCKLRHPTSGKLYTCRLCCEQEREMPTKKRDEPLDRYAVTEVLCMKCNALQPAGESCVNPNCESFGTPFAKYSCRICNLYDDRARPIFHCPYCNTCRSGQGLGIDYRHCMRCNACVSLADDDHRCLPQKLQGSCPICHESMFQSTQPLRGLQCGHVMHLDCYNTMYMRGHSYSCPLCQRSTEDMSDYFALLDAAVQSQPMPDAFASTASNIYCQDCEKTGQVPYHFVGLKCQNCGSYNTREMARVQVAAASAP